MTLPRPGMPQNQLPPEIYRRRRLLGLAVLAIVIWLLTTVISGIGNAINGGNTSPTSAASAPAAVAGGECAPGSVTVTAQVGTAALDPKAAFAAGVNPNMWWSITNTTNVACKFNYVAAATYFTITSGAETIWTNKDCATFATTGQDTVIDLLANETKQAPVVEWQRVRSSSSTGCVADGNAAATAGSYHLVATVSNVHSPDVQFLLN